MTRREAIGALAGAAAVSVRDRLPRGVHPAVATLLERTLALDPSSLNTDWFGTLLVRGVLEWGRRGIPQCGTFAKAWLEHHLGTREVARYSGAKSRTVMAGGVPITTYCGHFGMALPCYEMAVAGDARARRVVRGVADVILHQTARNRFGMVQHDDFSGFTIPDVCYFVAPPLAMAAALEPGCGSVYRDQAVYQLRTFNDVFLVKENGLAKTILLEHGTGKTYWTRATGWLIGSITGVLRYLPQDDPARPGFLRDLGAMAEGIARVQDSSGGLRLFPNDPASPLETTGTAMCAIALHESVRQGWLPERFRAVSARAWDFVAVNLSPEGNLRRAYTGWAVPAERGEVEMDRVEMGWIPGFVLSAAYELSL